jgi:hypothetical protein
VETRAGPAEGADGVFDVVGEVMFGSAVDSLALLGRLVEISVTASAK